MDIILLKNRHIEDAVKHNISVLQQVIICFAKCPIYNLYGNINGNTCASSKTYIKVKYAVNHKAQRVPDVDFTREELLLV